MKTRILRGDYKYYDLNQLSTNGLPEQHACKK